MRIEFFIPVIVIAVIAIVGSMMISAAKSDKKKKSMSRASDEKLRARLESRAQEESSLTDFSSYEKLTTGAPARKYVAPATTRKKVEKPAFGQGVDGTDLVEAAPRVHTSARVVGITKSHHDEHCDVDHSDDDLYIVEKVPVSGSIGGKSDEGCGEHYNLRFVKVEETESGNGKIALSPDDIRKAIILGEVINDPAFKK